MKSNTTDKDIRMIEYHKQSNNKSRRERMALEISLNPNFIRQLIVAKDNEWIAKTVSFIGEKRDLFLPIN